MPRPLRGIFRKRRKLFDHLFRVSTECLRDWMRARLDLPDGQLAAIAVVQTFGDYLNFHPDLHVLAATGSSRRCGAKSSSARRRLDSSSAGLTAASVLTPR